MSSRLDPNYCVPFPNTKVESLARMLAVDAKYSRNTDDEAEFEALPMEARCAFRMLAERYAGAVGVVALPTFN